jgi:polyhydroxybutyrate depolymerase
MPLVLAAALIALVAGCEPEPDRLYPHVFGGERPAALLVPAAYRPDRPAPLIVGLHGYGASGADLLELTGLDELPSREYAMVVAPDGVPDSAGRPSWNGTDACCDFDDRDIDDVGYLVELIDEIAVAWALDLDHVALVGFSGGGFMAYRAACDRADRFSAVVSIAGATFLDAEACAPTALIDVLHIHGDQDSAILYGGEASYPGARGTVDRWAAYNGCSAVAEGGGRLELAADVEGAETRIERNRGCPAGGSVELWTIEGGGHQPAIRERFGEALTGWIATR